MGLFNFMRPRKPEWVRALPSAIQLSPSQIARLEAIRIEVDAPNADFTQFILSQPESSRMVLKQTYLLLRQRDPNAPELVLLAQLIYSRAATAVITGYDLFGLRNLINPLDPRPTSDAIIAILDMMRARELTSFWKVVDAIMLEEEKLPLIPPVPHAAEAVRKASVILAESRL
ncbi:MAG TPA: hypothetical protein VFK04_04930 [Gemmatimonadaceae bacterium]|nr:hypothetical protein [Gemmatimonadaceae bacterium]